MTAKQKANRERFKAAIAEAKKIRAKNPKLTQAEAVKKAWAIIYSKKSKAVAVGAYYSMFSAEGNKAVTELVKYAKSKKLNRLQVQQKLNKLADTYPEAIDTAVIEKVDDKIFGKIMAKKSPARKTVKKSSPKKSSYHKDTKSHNVNIRVMSGIKVSIEEIKFLETEAKNSTGYNYRPKIIFGQECVLKETKAGTPVKKWIVDSYEKAKYLSEQLNKNKAFKNIKSKKL
jgi:hypothetical protein